MPRKDSSSEIQDEELDDDEFVMTSLRISRGMRRTLRAIAKIEGKDFSAVAREMFDEGIQKRTDPAYIEERVTQYKDKLSQDLQEMHAIQTRRQARNR